MQSNRHHLPLAHIGGPSNNLQPTLFVQIIRVALAHIQLTHHKLIRVRVLVNSHNPTSPNIA